MDARSVGSAGSSQYDVSCFGRMLQCNTKLGPPNKRQGPLSRRPGSGRSSSRQRDPPDETSSPQPDRHADALKTEPGDCSDTSSRSLLPDAPVAGRPVSKMQPVAFGHWNASQPPTDSDEPDHRLPPRSPHRDSRPRPLKAFPADPSSVNPNVSSTDSPTRMRGRKDSSGRQTPSAPSPSTSCPPSPYHSYPARPSMATSPPMSPNSGTRSPAPTSTSDVQYMPNLFPLVQSVIQATSQYTRQPVPAAQQQQLFSKRGSSFHGPCGGDSQTSSSGYSSPLHGDTSQSSDLRRRNSMPNVFSRRELTAHSTEAGQDAYSQVRNKSYSFSVNHNTKFLVRVGTKMPASVQSPACFARPQAVDIFPNGNIVMLDIGNNTLQLYNVLGVCLHVYTFAKDVVDMCVWDDTTVLLLKRREVVVFDIINGKARSINLSQARVTHFIRTLFTNAEPVHMIVVVDREIITMNIDGKVFTKIPLIYPITKQPQDKKSKPKSALIQPLTCAVDNARHLITVLDGGGGGGGGGLFLHTFSVDGQLTSSIPLMALPGSSAPCSLPGHTPRGSCVDPYGNLVLAMTASHCVMAWTSLGWTVLLQYSQQHFPMDVHVAPDNRLVVVIDSAQMHDFAGYRVYNYNGLLNDSLSLKQGNVELL